jgi:hypothetical protein
MGRAGQRQGVSGTCVHKLNYYYNYCMVMRYLYVVDYGPVSLLADGQAPS